MQALRRQYLVIALPLQDHPFEEGLWRDASTSGATPLSTRRPVLVPCLTPPPSSLTRDTGWRSSSAGSGKNQCLCVGLPARLGPRTLHPSFLFQCASCASCAALSDISLAVYASSYASTRHTPSSTFQFRLTVLLDLRSCFYM